jgi:DNA-binding CsgD family transcriptional regulator
MVKISNRENEILILISRGFTNSEIAKQLFLSEETVKSHRNNLLAKFKAKNSANLVFKAYNEREIPFLGD